LALGILSIPIDLLFHAVFLHEAPSLAALTEPENIFHWSMLLFSFVVFGLVMASISRRREAAAQEHRRLIDEMTKLKLGVERSYEAIFITDTDGKINYVNPGFEKLYGFSRAEAIGQTPRLIKSGTLSPDVYNDFWKTLLSKKVISGEIVNKTKAGKLLNIDGTALSILNDRGEIIGFMGIQHDITEHKQLDEALRRSKEDCEKEVIARTAELEQLRRRYELVLNSAAEGIFGLDLNGNHTFVNPAGAKLLGYEVTELIGRPSHSTWHYKRLDGRPYPKEECPIYAAFMEGKVHHGSDEVFWKKDGASFPVEYMSVPILESGKIVGAVVTFSDITERKQAEEEKIKDVELHERDRMKTEFLSMVSHEMRTPITPINGYLQLLLSGKIGPLTPEQKQTMLLMQRQSKHLLILIDSIIDVSRIETGRTLVLSKTPVFLDDLLKRVIEAMGDQFEEKGIELKAELSAHLPILADEAKLERVITNILGNALKFVPRGGSVAVGARVEAGAARVSFADNGIGIDRENLEKIFEKFYQVDSSNTRAAGGIGMGLTIAREIVEAHGGKIWAESDGLGKGAALIFTLPEE
jgi:PAS domain S-box-containing protein